MKIGLFAGSFDPITNGHVDIIKQSLKIFDKVIVAVACNSEKTGFLPVETRISMIKDCTENLGNVEAAQYDGLTVNFARKNNVTALIRGIRNSVDYEYETIIEQVNNKLAPEIPTVYFTASCENRFVSSSAVRELIKNNADLSKFVPENILKYLF